MLFFIENVLGDADLTTVMAGDWMAVMVAEEGADTMCGPVGGLPRGGGGVGDHSGVHVGGGGEVGGGAGRGRAVC